MTTTDKTEPTNTSTPSLRIAVLGTGKMGGILVQAFLRCGLFPHEHVVATVAHEARAQALSKQFGISVTTDNLKAAQDADVILLASSRSRWATSCVASHQRFVPASC